MCVSKIKIQYWMLLHVQYVPKVQILIIISFSLTKILKARVSASVTHDSCLPSVSSSNPNKNNDIILVTTRTICMPNARTDHRAFMDIMHGSYTLSYFEHMLTCEVARSKSSPRARGTDRPGVRRPSVRRTAEARRHRADSEPAALWRRNGKTFFDGMMHPTYTLSMRWTNACF